MSIKAPKNPTEGRSGSEQALASSVQTQDRRGRGPLYAVGATVLAIAVGVGAWAARGGSESNAAPDRDPTPAVTGDVTPGTEETPSNPEVTFEAMDAMPSDEFVTLPVKNQVNWAVTEINRAWNVEGIYENDALASLLGRESVDGATIDGYNPIYNPTGSDATAEEILGQQNYVEQLSSFAGGDLGRKLTSALALPGSPAHEFYYGSVGDISANTLGIKGPETRKPIDDQMNDAYIADDGTEYAQRTITELNNGSTFVETYVFVPSDTLEELAPHRDNTGLWLLVDFSEA